MCVTQCSVCLCAWDTPFAVKRSRMAGTTYTFRGALGKMIGESRTRTHMQNNYVMSSMMTKTVT